MMRMIRSGAGKVLVPVIIVAFILWMVLEIGMDVLGGGLGGPSSIGSVNGQKISPTAYNERYQALYQQAQQQGEVTPEMARSIEDQAWQSLVDEMLVSQELDRRGIGVSNQEVIWAAKNLPPPQLAQQEIFLTNGRFDLEKYRQFLSGPTAQPGMFAELEAYYRQDLPQRKLLRQLSAGRYVTDAELWRAYQDRNETATVDYVSLDLSRLPAPQVSDAEVRRYYQEHREEFRRPEGATLRVAYIPLTITEADRQATVQRAAALRNEITQGADSAELARRFVEVAQRESQDPSNAAQGGDLGVFGPGQMVPAFDSVVFALQPGQVSQPVTTQFGVHLVKVDSRSGDQVSARHILLRFEKRDEDVERLEDRLEAIRARGVETGLAAAARGQPGVTYREGVQLSANAPMIPGVGPAMEALSWAEEENAARADDAGERVSDVLEAQEALYLVELQNYHAAGITPLAEATPSIRAILENQKRVAAGKAEAEKMLAEIRGGRTLEQVAQARGFSVQRTGPFTRVDQNPVFGQANAAIGAAFGTPVGRVGPVAATPGGVFLIRPAARTQANRQAWEQQKVQQRDQAMAALQQDLFGQWMASVRRDAKIKDNRAQLRGRAAAS